MVNTSVAKHLEATESIDCFTHFAIEYEFDFPDNIKLRPKR